MIGIIGYTHGMTQLNIAPPIANRRMLIRLLLAPEPLLFDPVLATTNAVLSFRGDPASTVTTTVSVLVSGG